MLDVSKEKEVGLKAVSVGCVASEEVLGEVSHWGRYLVFGACRSPPVY